MNVEAMMLGLAVFWKEHGEGKLAVKVVLRVTRWGEVIPGSMSKDQHSSRPWGIGFEKVTSIGKGFVKDVTWGGRKGSFNFIQEKYPLE